MNNPIYLVKNLDYMQNKELLLKIKNFEIFLNVIF